MYAWHKLIAVILPSDRRAQTILISGLISNIAFYRCQMRLMISVRMIIKLKALGCIVQPLQIWQQNPLTQDLILAVNVSAKQFHKDDFVEQVLATIARRNIDPTHLKLELPESMLIKNISDIITKMAILSKKGISFSLDHFGTGYLSLQYLKITS
jgi:EAL domain-containing protein (putative c-di-GMP-specific phosphodiesterase class I)